MHAGNLLGIALLKTVKRIILRTVEKYITASERAEQDAIPSDVKDAVWVPLLVNAEIGQQVLSK
jgi:hypothetical protein